MELLIITAVQSYEEDIKKLLKKHGVKVFSHMDVNGYKELQEESREANWFASDHNEHRSVLFYAFIGSQGVDEVLNAIDSFNKDQDTESHVHAVLLEVKKSI
ncbi:hypothetical protein GCM10009122_06350 [Fulvivirga kasyanovii]|uniref:DUF3240 domain-containing protein n=1 Tax=Fulvivirga kasyanovii TaxID=396812 RepID=A0ABW9RU00_9BACT|nr:hypothetical protein [Fulvivirga kasyanovii]MTI27177.1 hypothetical protein [Fulvivirga kasyanovii]